MPVHIVLKGNLERYWNGLMSNEQNIGWMEWSRVDWMGDTPQTVMTTRAPAVLTNALFKCSLVSKKHLVWRYLNVVCTTDHATF